MAPEQFDKHQPYTSKCDMWAFGVCLYVMLAGKYPFLGENIDFIKRQIEEFDFDFDGQGWDNVSIEAKDLMTHLMCDA